MRTIPREPFRPKEGKISDIHKAVENPEERHRRGTLRLEEKIVPAIDHGAHYHNKSPGSTEYVKKVYWFQGSDLPDRGGAMNDQ